jgi:hypothetical protein
MNNLVTKLGNNLALQEEKRVLNEKKKILSNKTNK